MAGAAIAGSVYCAAGNAQTLTEAVGQAIASHPEVQTAKANWQAVAETVPQARALFLPSLDATLGHGRERTDSPVTRAPGAGALLSGKY